MKLYFSATEIDPEYCYTMKYWEEYIKEEFLPEVKLYEAKREVGTDYFWCKFYLEVGTKGEGCGRFCDAYKPRNGKNGRCSHSGFCYVPTDKIITIKNLNYKELTA